MTQIVSCNTQNIFGMDRDSISLVEQFCACPAAKHVLKEIAAKIVVQVGNFPHNRISYSSDSSQEVGIEIPTRMTKTGEALTSLIWEIFNAKVVPGFRSLRERAATGNLGMDKYATLMETEEFQSKKGSDELIKTCQPFYKIKPEPGSPDLDFTLWNHEINCHTDKIRERWIENFQETYCDNYPKDLKSCRVKTKNLCNFYKLQNSSPSEQSAQIQKRTCEKLPSAAPKIKEYYSSKYGNLETLCASVLSKYKTEL